MMTALQGIGNNIHGNHSTFKVVITTLFLFRRNKERPPLWDSFQDPPSKRATGSAANWAKLSILLKLFKLFTYVFVFATILATAVISKISFIFMVAQIGDKTSVKYCNIRGLFKYMCMYVCTYNDFMVCEVLILGLTKTIHRNYYSLVKFKHKMVTLY